MTSIYLIRHGQASFGQQDYDKLSELGCQQATRLGDAMSQRYSPFDKVVLGGMRRHHQTAKGCLEQFTGPTEADWHIDANWNEYDHQDIMAGMDPAFSQASEVQRFVMSQDNPKQAFETLFNQAMQKWLAGKHEADYVESWRAYQTRVQQAFADTVKQSEGHKNVAVFTSGGPISVITQSLLGIPADKVMSINWTLLNAGVTKIVATGNRTFVAALNEHSHFEGEFRHLLTYK